MVGLHGLPRTMMAATSRPGKESAPDPHSVSHAPISVTRRANRSKYEQTHLSSRAAPDSIRASPASRNCFSSQSSSRPLQQPNSSTSMHCNAVHVRPVVPGKSAACKAGSTRRVDTWQPAACAADQRRRGSRTQTHKPGYPAGYPAGRSAHALQARLPSGKEHTCPTSQATQREEGTQAYKRGSGPATPLRPPLPLCNNAESLWKQHELTTPPTCSNASSLWRKHNAHHRAKRKRPSRPAPSLTTQLMAAAASPVRLLDTPREASSDLVVNTLMAPVSSRERDG